jgi:phospholipid transport system substrate-binding protein
VPERPRRETSVDYRLHRKDGRWKVYDVLVDGVSFVSTYRTEFNRVISASSYRGLVESLRKGKLQARMADRRS